MNHEPSRINEEETYDSDSLLGSTSDEDNDLEEDNTLTHSKGLFDANVITLKEIAALQGHSSDSLENIVTEYGDWLLDDPCSLNLHVLALFPGF